MLDNKTLGIYVPSTKVFYYLECGESAVFNPIDRIKKTLNQRNIVRVEDNGSPTSYTILTYASLKNSIQSYQAQPIFLSKHIESLHKKEQSNESTSGLFKK